MNDEQHKQLANLINTHSKQFFGKYQRYYLYEGNGKYRVTCYSGEACSGLKFMTTDKVIEDLESLRMRLLNLVPKLQTAIVNIGDFLSDEQLSTD